MASNTGFLSTSELDFNAIKSNLKTYLKNQTQFADYDFEGSNMSVLMDILSYNTYLNGFYLNQVGSEMFLDTAQLKESAVSHAKELNYLPQSRTSAKAFVSFSIDTAGNNPSYVTVPKGYKFTTTVDQTSLSFTIPNDIIVRPANGAYAVTNTAIYEGNIVTEYYNVSNTSLPYVLGSENVDTSSLSIEVYSSNTSTTSYLYTQAESLFNITPTSNVYFLQGYSANKYQILFGNDVTGRSLSIGSLVKIQYRDTLGTAGNGAYIFGRTNPVDGYTVINVSTNFAAAEGSERESLESIQFNAPRYFPVQQRAVTAEDYIALTKKQFPMLESVIAFGGETMNPPQYGKVAISVKPYGTVGLVSDSLKTNIKNFLTLKNLTTEPIIVDPEFFYVGITSTINYNSSLTSLSSSQILSSVLTNINNYGITNLVNFGDDLRYSKLTSSIDGTDVSIIGNETSVKIIKRWNPKLSQLSTLSFSFDNEMFHENALYDLPQGHEHALKTDNFTYTNIDGVDYSCYIGDNGLGSLYVYTLQNLNGTTVRTPLNKTAGTVNYYTGEVIIQAKIKSYNGNHISIYGLLKNKDIMAQKNKFLLIENADVQVSITDIATS